MTRPVPQTSSLVSSSLLSAKLIGVIAATTPEKVTEDDLARIRQHARMQVGWLTQVLEEGRAR